MVRKAQAEADPSVLPREGPSPLEQLEAAWARRGAGSPPNRPSKRHPTYTPPAATWRTDRSDKVLWFHAGVHKTATTSLQISMAQNAPRLAERGVVVLPQYLPHRPPPRGASMAYRSGFRKGLNAVAKKTKMPAARREALLAELREQIGPWALAAPTLVLSDEDLLGARPEAAKTPYPIAGKHIAALQRLFPDHELRVILYVRDFASYLDACYGQSLKMKRPASHEDWLARVDLEQTSWVKVTNKIARRVGEDRLVVRRFESIREGFEPFASDFYGQFCDPEGLDLSSQSANPSLSMLGCDLARVLAPLFDRSSWKIIRRFLEDHFAGPDQPKARFLTGEVRQRLNDRYADELDTLRKRFGDLR